MVSGVAIFIIETAGVLPDRLFFCGWEAPFPSCLACWRGHQVMDGLYICARRASIGFSVLPIPIPAFPLSPKGICFAAKGESKRSGEGA